MSMKSFFLMTLLALMTGSLASCASTSEGDDNMPGGIEGFAPGDGSSLQQVHREILR